MADNSIATKCGNVKKLMESIKNGDWAQIPTCLYSFDDFTLPLTPTEFTANFNNNGGSDPINQPGVTGSHSTNLINNSATVLRPFLMFGAGVIAVGPVNAWTLPGAALTAPTSSTTTPCFDGAVGAAGVLASDDLPAVLENGGCQWRGIANLMRAMNLRFSIGDNVIFDELAADVGMVCEQADFNGMSDSLIPAHEWIRLTNDRYRAISDGHIFIPQNSAGTGAVPPPIVPASWGHPSVAGCAANCSMGYYRLKQPFLIVPPNYIDLKFRVVNSNYLTEAQRELTSNNGGNLGSSTSGQILLDQYLTAATGNSRNSAPTGANSSVYKFKSGKFSWGIVLKGVELTPAAVTDWCATYAPWDFESMVSGYPQAVEGYKQAHARKAQRSAGQ